MVKKKKASKRLSMRFKKGMEKKVKNKARKLRKIGKLNPNAKKMKKDPGVPNLWPFKQQLLGEIEESRLKAADQKAQQKVNRRKAAEKRRREEMVAKAPMRASEIKSSMGEQPEEKGDGFFLGQVQLKEQGALKRHWYFKELKKVVQVADVILEVLDARDPIGCRCLEVERQVLAAVNPDGTNSKRIILVLNKIDLVPSEVVGQWIRYLKRFFPTLAFKSSTQKQRTHMTQMPGNAEDMTDEQLAMKSCIGAGQLLGLLKNYSRTVGSGKRTISVGVIGFPNVGKSSIINSLKRSRAVAVGSTPGLTKAVQQVRLDKNITLVDSPGVLFGSEADKTLVLRNCLRVEQLEDPIAAVGTILERVHPEKIMTLYRLSRFSSTEEFLVLLANKLGKLGRGGIPNLKLAARHLLQDWNSGKIPFYTLPPVVQDVTQSTVVTQWAKEFNIDEYTKGQSDAVMALEQHQVSSKVQKTSYVVMEHTERTGSEAMETMEAMDTNARNDNTGMVEDEEESKQKDNGTTVGVKKIQLRDAQTNKQLKAKQKKLKKQKRRAAAVLRSQMQDEDEGMDDEDEEGDAVGEGNTPSSNIQGGQQDTQGDYDFTTDWS